MSICLHFSNPTPEESDHINITWLPVTKDSVYYLNLGEQLSLKTNPDNEKMTFWENLYQKYYKIWDQPQNNVYQPQDNEYQPQDNAYQPQPEEIVQSCKDTAEKVAEISDHTDEFRNNEENEVAQTNVNLSSPEEVPEPIPNVEPVDPIPETLEAVKKVQEVNQLIEDKLTVEEKPTFVNETNTTTTEPIANGTVKSKPVTRTSNEIKMISQANGVPTDVIRANDPPEDDLPKNIGVNKFVNFFESLGGKK